MTHSKTVARLCDRGKRRTEFHDPDKLSIALTGCLDTSTSSTLDLQQDSEESLPKNGATLTYTLRIYAVCNEVFYILDGGVPLASSANAH